jgi:hypothetical protein
MGAVNTTYTFTATDTITSSKMNNIIDQTTMTGDAILGTTLEVADGKLKIRSQGITSNELAADAVTTTKIADSNVTTTKIADLNVTTTKIADLNVTPAKLSQPLTVATAKNSTSGTSIDFTGIPSWVKRVTVMFNGISTNGITQIAVQLGTSSGFTTSGYISFCGYISSMNNQDVSSVTNGFGWWHGNAGDVEHGHMTITNISANSWVSSHSGGFSNPSTIFTTSGGGSVSLSGTFDRIRITTANGTDIFDAGSINIMYE